MYYVAYDNLTKKILGFINPNEQYINLGDVFKKFTDYSVIQTEEIPPIVGYEKYKICNDDISTSFLPLNIQLTELQNKEKSLKELKNELRSSDQILLDFLEGALTLSEYAETKQKRHSIRAKIKKLESEIQTLKGESNE